MINMYMYIYHRYIHTYVYTHAYVFMEEANDTILKAFIRIINLKKELEKKV